MRKKNDAYFTSRALTEHLLRRASVEIAGTVLEPCVGTGQMAAVLRQNGLHVETCDIDPVYRPDHVLDMTRIENWRGFAPDWIITNPPFSDAPQILPLALERARVGVAFLLRLTYLQPTGNRADWLQDQADHMTQLLVFGLPRPGFLPNPRATDAVTTAWFVWQKSHSWRAIGMEPPFGFITHWNEGGANV